MPLLRDVCRTRMRHAKAPRLEAVEHTHRDDDEQHVQQE